LGLSQTSNERIISNWGQAQQTGDDPNLDLAKQNWGQAQNTGDCPSWDLAKRKLT